MRFVYGKQDLRTLERAQEPLFLMTNGLGGYSSVTAAFSVPRCDQGILVSAEKAPNVRITLVHRLRETLTLGDTTTYLSTQTFPEEKNEEGYRNLSSVSYEYFPEWIYHFRGVEVKRRCAVEYGANTAAVCYTVENRSRERCTLQLTPFLKFAPKEDALKEEKQFSFRDGVITDGKYTLYIRTDGALEEIPVLWQTLAYPEDVKDGRPGEGKCGACCTVTKTVEAGAVETFEVVFSTRSDAPGAETLISAQKERLEAVARDCGLKDPVAQQLAMAADAYIARRDSTDGKTILAGYPLFSDWGRDTMIALPGCALATRRYEDAKSILRTFLAYEKDGLVPNLFPEGGHDPMYNTVDAALLLIDSVWQYVRRTDDLAFAREAWPVMERIIVGYRAGTHHSIAMDSDGLIRAGGGLDQMTWMDVCVNGILPTPRHGKPVEINAYWYNALRIMDALGEELGLDRKDYLTLAQKVKTSFVTGFYMEEKGYLKDVLSGTASDEQIRCNQIWAVSMPFTMLSPEQERSVVDTVFRHLYTPCGLRTLSPEDPEYHGFYGGAQVDRDMAYHQGTTWVFPMGGYYLAYLKTRGNTPEAAATVRSQLTALESMFREGCAGQLPEIYEGDFPRESKGCFAQAWSVGEMLRVYEAIQAIDTGL